MHFLFKLIYAVVASIRGSCTTNHFPLPEKVFRETRTREEGEIRLGMNFSTTFKKK